MIFHCPASGSVDSFFVIQGSAIAASGLYTSSEIAGMLLRLTEFTRETSVTANVALSSGSSQQGNARRAAVGYTGEL